MGEIVATALEALGPQPQPVLADIPSGLPEVIADPAIAERVIVNLTGNALRYSPAAAPLLLTARTAGNRVELRVVDHGPGIAAADDAQPAGSQRDGAGDVRRRVGDGQRPEAGLIPQGKEHQIEREQVEEQVTRCEPEAAQEGPPGQCGPGE